MRPILLGLLLLCLCPYLANAQDQPGTVDKITDFPTKFFSRVSGKTSSLDDQLSRQTQKYLNRLAKREERLKRKIGKIDSASAQSLFGNSPAQYAALAQKMRTDTGAHSTRLSGEYFPNVDSLQGSLSFLKQQPQLLGNSAGVQAKIQTSLSQLQQLQARMQDADAIKQYAAQRQAIIQQYLTRFTQLPPGLASELQGMKQEIYYYSTEVKQYKQMLNDPDAMEQKALAVLGRMSMFQNFMKSNGQLAGLFGHPANYGSSEALVGLQTRSQIDSLVQGKVAGGGAAGAASLQQSLQSAHDQLDQFKDKLNKLGAGSGDMTMPDFTPNNQKTKSLLKRLELGINIQTVQSTSYYPTLLNLGLSLGYHFTDKMTAGVGLAYELGTGNGIQHISFSSQGISLRSYFDMKIKKTFYASGGLEYNYLQPFTSYGQIRHFNTWQQSGLVGISKIVSLKSKAFKQTKVSLLWDVLSYQQVPKTSPFVFRVGYSF